MCIGEANAQLHEDVVVRPVPRKAGACNAPKRLEPPKEILHYDTIRRDRVVLVHLGGGEDPARRLLVGSDGTEVCAKALVAFVRKYCPLVDVFVAVGADVDHAVLVGFLGELKEMEFLVLFAYGEVRHAAGLVRRRVDRHAVGQDGHLGLDAIQAMLLTKPPLLLVETSRWRLRLLECHIHSIVGARKRIKGITRDN